MLSSDLHSENVDPYMIVRLFDKVMLLSDVHSLNAILPKNATLSGITISVKALHPEKAPPPILVTEGGILIL